MLLQAFLTAGANAAGVEHAAHGRHVALFELGHCAADLGDAANNLMAGHARIDRRHKVDPLILGLVQIGVTDTAKQNFDLDVVGQRLAPGDGSGDANGEVGAAAAKALAGKVSGVDCAGSCKIAFEVVSLILRLLLPRI